MSYCVDYGKDKVIFLTNEDLNKPSTYALPEVDFNEEPRGFLLPNGEINWECPCLGNMVIGPCNVEFKQSLTCFHKSEAEPKGSDCIEKFHALNECMARHPKLYPKDEDDEEDRRLDEELNRRMEQLNLERDQEDAINGENYENDDDEEEDIDETPSSTDIKR